MTTINSLIEASFLSFKVVEVFATYDAILLQPIAFLVTSIKKLVLCLLILSR